MGSVPRALRTVEGTSNTGPGVMEVFLEDVMLKLYLKDVCHPKVGENGTKKMLCRRNTIHRCSKNREQSIFKLLKTGLSKAHRLGGRVLVSPC